MNEFLRSERIDTQARKITFGQLALQGGEGSGFSSKISPDDYASAVKATDWRLVNGASQSGLPLHWRDGLPVLPELTPLRRARLVVKRIADIVLSSFGLLILFPLLVAFAIATKVTSSGPVFFRQPRVGLDGESFEIFKFRTMYIDHCDDGTKQARVGDARVTPLGRFMRNKSIDELPQLLNVLKGDMSLVGPRPHVAGMLAAGVTYETLVPYYPLRHAMKPGLTGWAQANGFRGMTIEAQRAIARVDHDLAYIQNFSIWLDIRCLALTVWHEFFTGSGH